MSKTNDVDVNMGKKNATSESVSKLYRFEVILRAIDFFSEKFDVETLLQSTNDFANEALTLNCSALFTLDEANDTFILSRCRNYPIENYTIPDSDIIQKIALLYGDVMTKNFQAFFDEKFIVAFNPQLLIPIISNSKLKGFIVSDGKAIGKFESDDSAMASGLMHIFNNAFEKAELKEKISTLSEEHESESFNIYALNKRVREIVKASSTDILSTLTIDAFSEMTKSMATSFGLYEPETKSINVMTYKDVLESGKSLSDISIPLKTTKIPESGCVLDIKKDADVIAELVEDAKALTALNAKYLVLIGNETILGMVTLGKQMLGAPYTDVLFQTIESLAISTYLALNQK